MTVRAGSDSPHSGQTSRHGPACHGPLVPPAPTSTSPPAPTRPPPGGQVKVTGTHRLAAHRVRGRLGQSGVVSSQAWCDDERSVLNQSLASTAARRTDAEGSVSAARRPPPAARRPPPCAELLAHGSTNRLSAILTHEIITLGVQITWYRLLK